MANLRDLWADFIEWAKTPSASLLYVVFAVILIVIVFWAAGAME